MAAVAGEAVLLAGGHPDPDVVLRHDGGAVLMERRVAAGVIAVVMGVDQG